MKPNKKTYMIDDEENGEDGNVATGGNMAGVVLTGYNVANEDSTFDNAGFHLESHDKANGFHNPPFSPPVYQTKDFTCDMNHLENGTKNHSVGGRQKTMPLPISHMLKEKARNMFTRKMLHKKVPICQWLPEYNSSTAVSDLVAGVTVGLTVIPQAIAYSNVAGLPPQVGLYSSFVACFVYTVLGSCKDCPIGPTAIMAILTRENLHGLGTQFAIFLTFMSGIVQLLMGVLQLGFLIDFISGPVSVGFTSAAAIIIATSQIKDLLGLNYSASRFVDVWDQLSHHIKDTSKGDAILGISCMVILLLLRKVKDIPIGPSDTKEKTTGQKLAEKTLWFISTARNILVVIFCGMLGYYYDLSTHGKAPFKLSADVEAGLPPFQPPPFSLEMDGRLLSFFDMTSELGSAILVIPLLSILENISLAKVFSDGKSIDANQEMLALGACNILSSFVNSMPVTGALSRGAVNNASGVKTTFGGVYTGIIVIVSLQFFTPYFKFIPKASLAAVIIAAVVFMVEFHVVKPMWRTKKIDLIPAAATFLTCLLVRLEMGMVIGVSINVLFLLYSSARPRVEVEKLRHSSAGFEYLTITPDRALVFPSVGYVRNVVSKAGRKDGNSSMPVVIDSSHIQGADFTAAKGISSLIEDFVQRNQDLIFYNLRPSVVEIFQGVQPKHFKHCQTEQELSECLRESHLRSLQNHRTIEKR